MIDSPPHVMCFVVDLHEDLVQIPLPVRMSTKLLHAPFTNFNREHRSKTVPPETDRFMADIDPAFEQKIFYIPE